MKYKLTLLSALLVLAACQSVPPSSQYSNVPLTDGVLATAQWQQLTRIEPLYPVEEARSGKEGCATIEFIITPDYQITDVQAVSFSSRFFAREAQKALLKWNWQDLPAGLLTEPLKTQTRFEFCLESDEGRCTPEKLAQRDICSGTDVLPVVGYRVMVRN